MQEIFNTPITHIHAVDAAIRQHTMRFGGQYAVVGLDNVGNKIQFVLLRHIAVRSSLCDYQLAESAFLGGGHERMGRIAAAVVCHFHYRIEVIQSVVDSAA